MAGIATPPANKPEDDESPDTRKNRRAANGEHGRGCFGRLVPETLVELDACLVAEGVEAVELEATLTAMVERSVCPGGCRVVLPGADRHSNRVGVDPAHQLVVAPLVGKVDALLDRLTPPLREAEVSQH